MKLFQTAVVFATAALIVASSGLAFAQAADTNAVAGSQSDADKAWKDVEKAARPPMPPPEWQTQRPTQEQIEAFRSQQGVLAGEAADKAKDFYTRFPNHPKAGEAHKKEYEMLFYAVRLGNSSKEAALEAAEQERLKDPTLPEDQRVQIRIGAIQRLVSSKESEGQTAMLDTEEKAARDLLRDFPKRSEGYQLLMEVAEASSPDKALAITKEITEGSASEEVKAAAKGLAKKLQAVGKPLAIAFKAVDGREVDLSKMKGKVVLIDFWATWCGPCVAELPNVKKAYDSLHPKGFEIVGISFDADQHALEQFVSDKEMKWPQFFDGKRWQNKYGQEFGINSIPAMWLVDKKGNLRDMKARGALEEKVEKLLAEE